MKFGLQALMIGMGALALAGSAAASPVLFSQAYDGGIEATASQNDVGNFGNFATSYDTFSLNSAATVTGVSVTGLYFNPGPPGAITGFTLGFYADNAGTPGSQLQSVYIAGNGGETADGSAFDYSFATNFSAQAGTTYWLSVVPDMVFPPQWGWSTATSGPGDGYQAFFGNGGTTGNNYAFTLTGNAVTSVPEPAAWALMLVGFGGLGVGLRARRRAAVAA